MRISGAPSHLRAPQPRRPSPPRVHVHVPALARHSSICSAFVLHLAFNCILESDMEKVEVTET